MLHNYVWVVISAFLLAGMLFAAGCDDEDSPAAEKGQETKAVVGDHDNHDHEHDGHGESHTPTTGQVQTEITQKKCPVMGDPIDPDVFVEHEGRKVYFCCEACIEKFEKDPAKYLTKLESR